MSDKDYSKMTNAEIDRLVGNKVMGGAYANYVGFKPTTNTEHSAWVKERLMSLGCRIEEFRNPSGDIISARIWFPDTPYKDPDIELVGSLSVDFNCCRIWCLMALRAYEQENTR